MSKANGTIENKDTFLQHVSLKNYKSIKDVEIDFKPGLNIIIGKNASGKTNFINGLDAILNFKYSGLLDSESKISALFQKDKIQIEALTKDQLVDNSVKYKHLFSLDHRMFLTVNDERIEVNGYDEMTNFFDNYSFNEVLVQYGIRYQETARFINIPFSFSLVNNGKVVSNLMTVVARDNNTRFINKVFQSLYADFFKYFIGKKEEISIEEVKDRLILISELNFKYINDSISIYSPINAIRLNPDFNVIKEDNGQKQTISNFYIEFLIDTNWVTFSLLSDGTKRLFYIISEVLSTINYDGDLSVILLEEPELGIHPHQLHQLMQFIKEQSHEKQIILTTHSPQVLDVIGPDELDRIIICHSDPKNGTQLSHLTLKEITKARKYMKEEAFLSDYWRFSDLEPAS